MPRAYYANPTIGSSIANLTEVLVGDPLQDARAGLIGDQRRRTQADTNLLGVDRQRLLAEARLKEQEHRAIADQQARTPGVAGALSSILQAPDAAPLIEFVANAPGNASQSASGLSDIAALVAAMTGSDDMRMRSLVAQGKLPDADTAVSVEGQDRIATRNALAALTEAMSVQGLQEEGAMARNTADNATRVDVANLNNNSRERIAATKPASSSGRPPKVTVADMKLIEQLLTDATEGMGAKRVDPGLQNDLRRRASELLQQTGNPNTAVHNAIAQIIGAEPNIEDPWFGSPILQRSAAQPTAPVQSSELERAAAHLANPNLLPEDRARILAQYPELADRVAATR